MKSILKILVRSLRSLSTAGNYCLLALGLVSALACSGTAPPKVGSTSSEKEVETVKITLNVPKIDSLEAEVSDIKTKLNGFFVSLKPVSLTCPGTTYEETRDYDYGQLTVPVLPNCNYQISLMLGSKSASALALADTVTYNDGVKAFLDKYCTSCHKADGSQASSPMSDYAGAKKWGKTSAGKIDDATMPPGVTLTAAEKKLFADWVAGGLLESAPTENSSSKTTDGSSSGSSGNQLSAVYYQNNEIFRMKPSDLKSGKIYQISFVLDLQNDGKSLGLKTASLGEAKTDSVDDPGNSGTSTSGGANTGSSSTSTGGTTGGTTGGSTTTAKLTYNDTMKAIIDNKCATSSCHAAGKTSPDLSIFQTKTIYDSSIARINNTSSPMPPASATVLTADERSKWKDWQTGGYTEK